MKFKRITLAALVCVGALSLASCKTYEGEGVYTYNTYTTLTPSNWNELTYQDNNDTEILNFISSSFFNYDFKYDENGEIVSGEFDIEYAAATKLEDVTATYAGDENYDVPAAATSGYAYKITLRDDLVWDDGEAITADDFIYSMKEQLNPLFLNYRADSFYQGALVIHNAKEYVFQGQSDIFPASTAYSTYSTDLDDQLIFHLGPASEAVPATCYVRDYFGFPASYDAAKTAAWLIANYLSDSAFTAEAAAQMEDKTLAEIKADETLNAAWEALLGFWQTEPNEELHFFAAHYTFPELSFDKVGMFKGANDLEIVIVLDNSLQLLDENGDLTYKAAYNFGGLPLVQESKYEQYKHAPAEGSELWTTTYNQDVASTSSWGPYKLTEFQAGKIYVLEKNENWWGYNDPAYEGQYQTDKIVCEQVKDWNTAWLMFQAGDVDSVSIDVTIAAEYKNSEQAVFTPSDFVSSLQLQSDEAALQKREDELGAGYNKTMLLQPSFRKALSLAIDRAAFANQVTTSSLAGFGLFNSMHYYDVANGGVYRNEDVAKQVLCEVYGVDPSNYSSLTAAEAAITGYNLTLARQLVEEAYQASKAAGHYVDGEIIKLEFGTGSIVESTQRQFDFIKNAWTELLVGTSLEGKLELELVDHLEEWANDFRAGGYEVCMGGWTGAAWDPGYFLLAYLDPDYMYSKGWDTENHQMEFTLTGEGENGEDVTLTLGLLEWYDILNGAHDTYDWSAGAVEDSIRLKLIAALEKEILSVYYTVPLVNSYSASLISYKWEYATREYNTFMGYGGIRYITYNYDDADWARFVDKNKGSIDYR